MCCPLIVLHAVDADCSTALRLVRLMAKVGEPEHEARIEHEVSTEEEEEEL